MSSQRSQDAPTAQKAAPKLRRAGVIQPNPNLCLACRECEVACSLYHEGECSPVWSRIQIDANDFVAGLPEMRVCKQCDWPACYYACVDRWEEPAIVIDERTGARTIEPSKCRGCGSCVRACPLTPERAVISYRAVGRKRIHFKCDLCQDRPEGPLCVEICPGEALTYIPAEERRR
jgi:carbon-monoxide dehydrogenase iron sulfur subunit